MFKGEVAYLYAFDVANEIDTSRVRRVLSKKAVTLEFELSKSRPRDMSFTKPLEVVPKISKYKYNGQAVHGIVRIYDVGAVTVTIRIPFEVKQITDLLPFHNLKLEKDKSIDEIAKALCVRVRDNIKDSLIRPHNEIGKPEAYTVFCIKEIAAYKASDQFLEEHQAEIVSLLTETEPSELSSSLVREVVNSAQSYETTDLVVVDWDAALIVELDGYMEDTLYALEVANLQSEEIKALDNLIDKQLEQSYLDLRQGSSIFSSVNANALKRLREVRFDVIRLKEEIFNTGKFFGDWYLARVYMTAREKLKILEWQKSVEDKLNHLNQLYSVLSADATNKKMVWLEALIVLLFIIDLIAVFLLNK